MKKIAIGAAIVQILIFVTIALRDEPFSLLSYINTSFIFGGILTFIGATIYVVQSGFFDIFTISIRKAFHVRSTFDRDEMRAPSELLSIPFIPVLSIGSFTILLMGVALFSYYQ
ncbi:DUF3899 domain-containing protein [Indiicoccus explosivorum]|uniref:DUF3899 domain-containing protein n=1 Tax=Indiicoccus explosivorum TaxID=1917864 RepID=UPI000B447C4C|nr:DUF3899 domain-containing protein [Indiicoccus explosivorum]